MPAPRTTVVIVTYRSRGTIDLALAPLADAAQAGQVKIVVVDNASHDETVEYVRAKYPAVEVREPGANLGFGRGSNFGANDASTEFVLLLNPDAAIGMDDLAKLEQFLDTHPRAGICGPAVLDQPQMAGMLTGPMGLVRHAWGIPGHPDARLLVPGEEPFRTTWLCGAAMLIRTALYQQLEGFDPRFFLYFEETDLCLRIHQAGYELWAVPSALSTHSAGASAKKVSGDPAIGNIPEHFYQSRFYYLQKHHGWLAAAATDVGELLALTLKATIGSGSRARLAHRLRGTLLRSPQRAR